MNNTRWYNYKTNKFELRNAPKTDEEAYDLLPQSGGVGLFKIYRELGDSILEAMIKVYSKALGSDVPTEDSK